MKNLILLFVLGNLVVNAQNYKTYDLSECPLYSKIWVSNYGEFRGDKINYVLPKNGGNFGFNTSYVSQNIDVDKIQSYLLESFNEFRKDYKCGEIKEDTLVSRKCREYSKLIFDNFVHDVNLPSNQSECVGRFSFMTLSKVTKEDGDLNKLIAESCFDIFIGCPAHTAILLNNNRKYYGFGVSVQNGSIGIVIRGAQKGSF
jgi:hypothetical protein